MSLLYKRWSFFIFAWSAIIGICLILAGYWKSENTSLPLIHVNPLTKPISSIRNIKETPSVVAHQDIATEDNEPRTVVGTRAEQEIVRRWELSRGRVNLKENDDYMTYSKESLEELANSGDFLAGERLIDLYLKTGDIKHLYSLCKQLAAYGSTRALERLSTSAAAEAFGLQGEAQKEKIIEAMAYFKVQEMRGDDHGYFLDIEGQQSNIAKIPLTENDYSQVATVAQKIYDDLQNKRIDLGLGKFDNSAPVEVKNYFNEIDPRARGYTAHY